MILKKKIDNVSLYLLRVEGLLKGEKTNRRSNENNDQKTRKGGNQEQQQTYHQQP